MSKPNNSPYVTALRKGSIYNDSLFQKIIGGMTKLTRRESGGDIENDLLADTFKVYHRTDLSEKHELPEGRQMNKRLLDWVMESSGFATSRETTANKLMKSIKSAELLTEMLVNDPEVKKAMEEQQKADDLNKQADDAQNDADDAGKQGDKQGQQKAQSRADSLRQAAKQMSKTAENRMDKRLGNPMMAAVRASAVKKAQEKADEVGAVMDGFGMEDGDFQKMSDEELEEAMKFIDGTNMEALIAMIGRVKGIAMKHATAKPDLTLTITDYGYTHDLPDVFDAQRMSLHPDMPDAVRAEAMVEWIDSGLPGLKREAPPKSRGTIVMGKDGSGSMSVNGRNERAAGLSLGIFRAAEATGQEWRAFSFGSDQDELSPILTPEATTAEQIEFVTIAAYGGTDFNSALIYAIQAVEQLPEPEYADIVLITDGQATINHDTRNALKALKERHGCRFFGILVDQSSYGDIKSVADGVITIAAKDDIAKAAEQLSSFLWDGR